jgi:hypothetical protein
MRYVCIDHYHMLLRYYTDAFLHAVNMSRLVYCSGQPNMHRSTTVNANIDRQYFTAVKNNNPQLKRRLKSWGKMVSDQCMLIWNPCLRSTEGKSTIKTF